MSKNRPASSPNNVSRTLEWRSATSPDPSALAFLTAAIPDGWLKVTAAGAAESARVRRQIDVVV